jgi:hypothetical protein
MSVSTKFFTSWNPSSVETKSLNFIVWILLVNAVDSLQNENCVIENETDQEETKLLSREGTCLRAVEENHSKLREMRGILNFL